MAKESKSGGNDVFLSLLSVLFIGLKLTGIIDWSWFWVLSPIIIPIGLFLIIAGIVVLYELLKSED